MEAASSGKLESGHDHAAALQPDCDFGRGKIVGVEHNQRSVFGRIGMRFAFDETAVDARAVETDVIRPIIDKTPAEDGGIELLGPLNVSGMEFDVVDLVVICFFALGCSPLWFDANGGEGEAGAAPGT